MTGTTPTYGWPYPQGTDRVADGDNAIEALARAVEGTVSGALTGSTAALIPGSGWAITNGHVTKLGNLAVVNFVLHTVGTPPGAGAIAGVPAGYRPLYDAYSVAFRSSGGANVIAWGVGVEAATGNVFLGAGLPANLNNNEVWSGSIAYGIS